MTSLLDNCLGTKPTELSLPAPGSNAALFSYLNCMWAWIDYYANGYYKNQNNVQRGDYWCDTMAEVQWWFVSGASKRQLWDAFIAYWWKRILKRVSEYDQFTIAWVIEYLEMHQIYLNFTITSTRHYWQLSHYRPQWRKMFLEPWKLDLGGLEVEGFFWRLRLGMLRVC